MEEEDLQARSERGWEHAFVSFVPREWPCLWEGGRRGFVTTDLCISRFGDGEMGRECWVAGRVMCHDIHDINFKEEEEESLFRCSC